MEIGGGVAMDDAIRHWVESGRRIKSALMVLCALMLFLAGFWLLFAPAPGRQPEKESRLRAFHFPCGADGWIMGSQSHHSEFMGGG